MKEATWEKIIKISIDEESNIVYICLDNNKKIVDSEEVRSGIVFDFDERDRVVGVEVHGKSKITVEQLKKIN